MPLWINRDATKGLNLVLDGSRLRKSGGCEGFVGLSMVLIEMRSGVVQLYLSP